VSPTTSTSEVQENLALYHGQVLSSPVQATKQGLETVYTAADTTYHEMKQAPTEGYCLCGPDRCELSWESKRPKLEPPIAAVVTNRSWPWLNSLS
jgi:hypothetical protein